MSATAQPALLFGRWPFRTVAVALFFATFLFDSFGNWSLPLLHNDEARFTEAAREMRERSDWIVPHFNGDYRFDKPPLIYWCQAPAMALLGENEYAARLHSVLGGALLAVVIFAFGARLFHIEAGFWAAIIFTTSLRVAAQAKGATSDMLLTLFVTLVFWAGWELLKNCVREPKNPHGPNVQAGAPSPLSPQRGEGLGVRGGMDKEGDETGPSSPPAWRSGWWWLFYVSLALAFLAKGPAGWLPLLALPLYARWTKTTALNRRFRFELGLPLMLGLVALWAVPAYVRTHGEYLRVGIGDHVIRRMTTGYDGQGAANIWIYLLGLPFYFVLVFASFVGWSTWFPWCCKQLQQNNYGSPVERYLLAGMAVIFVVFTLGSARFPHYIMPAFPLVALLLAGLWWRAGRSRRTLVRVAAVLAVSILLLTTAAMWLFPRYVPGQDLAKKCAPFLKTNSAFGAVELEQASLVWYFRLYVRDFRHLLKPDEAAAFMAQPGPRFCIMERQVAAEKFPVLPPEWTQIDAPHAGYYSGTNRTYFLTVLIKPEDPSPRK